MDVLIVGAGKLGALLHDCLFEDERWRCTGFIDDGKAGHTLHGLPVRSFSDYHSSQGRQALLAIGYPDVRKNIIQKASGLGLEWQTYIDRRTMVGQEATLGEGVIILSFAMVASGVTIGPFSYLSSYSHVGTGSRIGTCSSLMAGASVGESIIGDECVLGLRSACLDGAVLGDRVTVAPFTCIRRTVPSDSLVAGNPARILKRKS